jgi:mono/diheme cytochrome c family protein
MKASISVLLLTLSAAAPPAFAQKAEGDLNATQAHGRQVFAQSCGICHLSPSLGAKTYGPVLNRGTVGGSDEAMRAIIANGTERMPAFKYYLNASEIDAIIAYVRTVPAPVARASNEPQRASSVANAKDEARRGE